MKTKLYFFKLRQNGFYKVKNLLEYFLITLKKQQINNILSYVSTGTNEKNFN